MDTKQKRSLALMGFSVEEIDNLKKIPRTTLYNREGIALENLPADQYHLQRYLKRGFTTKPPLTTVSGKSQMVNPIGFTCETCGKQLKTRLALAGHSRSHKVEVEV